MLLIFGIRARASSIGQGVFFCPNCGADRHYTHKRMRRWFTLFFLPVIPLNVLGEFVSCDSCKVTFKTLVLEAPTTAGSQAELTHAMREAMTLLLRITHTPAAEAAAIATLSAFAGDAWPPEQIGIDLESLDTSPLPARLAALAPVLNEHGKERFVGACAHVVSTGGVIEPAARQAVERIAADLLMTPAHARGVIDQTLESAGA